MHSSLPAGYAHCRTFTSSALWTSEWYTTVVCTAHHARSFLSFTTQVVCCEREEVPSAIADAHVAVPLMTRIDADVMSRARSLKLILQFGVGLEGTHRR